MKNKKKRLIKKVEKKKHKKVNVKVVLTSILGLIFLALSYFVNWMFLIGSALAIYFNQRELTKV